MKINHIGIVVKDIDQSIEYYKQTLSWNLISKKIYDPIQKVFIAFLKDKENGILYELIEPDNLDSPVANLISKRISLYHICYEVNDINKSIESLKQGGFILISQPEKAIAFNMKLVAFLMSKDNLIIELVEMK